MKYPVSVPEVNLYGGKFTNGDPLLGIPRSIDRAEDMNRVYDELINVVTGAGLTPSEADNTQLLQAITNLIKGPADKIVRVASTAAINLTAPGANIDGTAMVAGDTFLEKDNATLADRGVYVWNGAAVPATRDPLADTGAELFGGMIIRVKEGTANADTNWQVTNDGVVTIGVTGLTFAQVGSQNFASNAEAQAFAVTNKPISPATLAAALQGSNQSLADNGYQKLPGGLIVQWGSTASLAAEAEGAVTFPVAFPSVSKVMATFTYTGARFDSSQVPHVREKSLVGFTAVNDQVAAGAKTGIIDWFAIGY